MKRVYLAGAISGQSYEGATDWRNYAKERLAEFNIEGMSPMRGKDYILGKTSIGDQEHRRMVMSTQKGITTRDRNDVMTSDALIVNLLDTEKASIGTMIELGWADAFRKPIILVLQEGNVHDHSMVRELSGFIVQSVDDAIAVAAALLNSSTNGVYVSSSGFYAQK